MNDRRDFFVGDPAAIEVRLPAGRIEILPGEPGRIAVDVGGRDADRVLVEQVGDTVSIRPDEAGPILRGSQVTVSVEVPQGCALRAHLATAGLTSRADLGSARIKAASGDIRLTSASTVQLGTASGDAWIDVVHGGGEVSTASGEIYVGKLGSGGTISTASGDVRVADARGSLTLKTVSGDVRVERFDGTDLTLSTVSGDVSVGMVGGRRVSVDLTTLSGRIELPRSPGSPEDSAPGPVTQLRFRSISGDLRVTRAEPETGGPISEG